LELFVPFSINENIFICFGDEMLQDAKLRELGEMIKDFVG
jgi:hypothetical protein